MKQHWQQLNEQEKRTVTLGGIVLGVLIFVRFIWWPMFHHIEVQEQTMEQEAALIEWMQPRVARIVQARQTPQTNSQQPRTLATFDQSIQKTGLKKYVTDFNQSADQKIHVQFKAVPFEKLTDWLEGVIAQGFTLDSITVQKGSKVGLTDVVLVMSL